MTDARKANRERSPRVRYAWLALAYVALALGLVGLVLPAIPTAPFVIVAAWAATRGSRKLHRWLRTHKAFGPMVCAWEDHGAVPRRAKWIATISMALGMVSLLVVFRGHWYAFVGIGTMLAVAVWLWMRPEPPAAVGG
ncbi:MAG TPA: YbaN family protein [Xanthomonadales bacterium]|nr:YbaN family protein [Xanthomonadales bacterium]